jgi:hypothetical protein
MTPTLHRRDTLLAGNRDTTNSLQPSMCVHSDTADNQIEARSGLFAMQPRRGLKPDLDPTDLE